MNHHQRHTPPGAKRALRGFALLLVAILSSHESPAALRLPKCRATAAKVTARGYLSVAAAPGLRFQEPVLFSVRQSTKPVALARASETTASPDAVVPRGDPSSHAPESAASIPVSPEENAPQKTKSGAGQRILPDNARPITRPEDFLPFFRFPAATGQSGSVDVILPVPADAPAVAPLPPSSATYFQSPK